MVGWFGGMKEICLVWWAGLVGWFGGEATYRAFLFRKVNETRHGINALVLSLSVSSYILVVD